MDGNQGPGRPHRPGTDSRGTLCASGFGKSAEKCALQARPVQPPAVAGVSAKRARVSEGNRPSFAPGRSRSLLAASRGYGATLTTFYPARNNYDLDKIGHLASLNFVYLDGHTDRPGRDETFACG